MKTKLLVLIAISSLLACKTETKPAPTVEQTQKLYEPNWSSLSKHQIPQWLLDAKFGIYTHWGVASAIPDRDNWVIPFSESVDIWKAENFSAKEWVALFESAGAKFAGPVAWHGNGFLHWDSEITPWCSGKKGPKRDILGELAEEIKKSDMKLMASFHSSTMWGPISTADTTDLGADKIFKRATKEPQPLVFGKDKRYKQNYMDGWLERMNEATDKYQPDLVWLDVGFGGTMQLEKYGFTTGGHWNQKKKVLMRGLSDKTKQRYISHFYNMGIAQNKDVEFIYKVNDVPPTVGMRNIENGLLQDLQYDPWMTDIDMQEHTLHSKYAWFYNPKLHAKSANTLIDKLIDVTSKNGVLLLNVPPKANGTFSDEITTALLDMGKWLRLNGEAIYGTMPWSLYGEGPTMIKHTGHYGEAQNFGADNPKYTSKDIRYTQKGDDLYAICLDWPGEKVVMKALGHGLVLYPDEIKNITLIGSDEKLQWEHKTDELVIQLPKNKPCDFAYVFKIERR